MALDFFTFWVLNLWGSPLMALFGTGLIFAVILVLGRMSYQLMTMCLILYFCTFSVGFYGIVIFLLLFIFSFAYFIFSLYRFIMRE